MKHRLLALFLSLPGWVAFAQAPAAGTPAKPPPPPPPHRLEIPSGKEIASEIWAIKREVVIAGRVRKDLFFQSSSADLSGEFQGDIWAAVTGPLRFTGRAGDDFRAFVAGLAHLDGHIAGNLLLRSDAIQMGTNTVVAGEASLISGTLVQDGRIGGNFSATVSGAATIKGEILGDATLAAAQIILMPGAKIHGRLVYDAPDPPQVPPGAMVTGEIRREAQPATPYEALIALVLFLGYSGFGLLAVGLFPKFIGGAQAVLARMKFACVFNGGITLILGVLLASVFFSSPLVMFLGLLLAAALLFADGVGMTILAAAIGGVLLPARFTRRAAGRAASLVLGMLVAHLAFLVPVAGPFLLIFAHLAGIGAVIVYSIALQRPPRLQTTGVRTSDSET